MKRLSALFALLYSLSIFAGPRDVYQDMLKGKAIIFDVREAEELTNGKIKGATWVPFSSLQNSEKETIEKVKALSGTKSIHMYCRSGRRTKIFTDKLIEKGIPASNLGGFEDLKKAGLPVE